jgi:hypothetical protein
MTKLHLRARAPNEGARRLAQWILATCAGDLARAAKLVPGWAIATFERLIAGDVVPGSELIEPLARRAGIEPAAWRRPPAGGWFDPPASRAV